MKGDPIIQRLKHIIRSIHIDQIPRQKQLQIFGTDTILRRMLHDQPAVYQQRRFLCRSGLLVLRPNQSQDGYSQSYQQDPTDKKKENNDVIFIPFSLHHTNRPLYFLS